MERWLNRKPGMASETGAAAGVTAAGQSPPMPSDLAEVVLNCSPDRIDLIDALGRLRLMNAPGRRLMHLQDGDDPVGSSWLELWPAGDQPVAEEALQTARSRGVAHFAAYCPTARGEPRWWDVTINAVREADGSVAWLVATARDVSAYRNIEGSLRESEQRFRALADNMAQFAWMADWTGSIFWYNQRWFDYTGTTLEQMRGWGWRDVHHPDHIERVVQRITHCFGTGEVWEDVFPLRGADGEYRWFLSRAMPIRDETGRVMLWCGTNTDINDQRAAGQRLRQLARILEMSHEAILVWDPERGIIVWNRGCEELYGFSRAEAIGARSHDLLQTRRLISHEAFEVLLREEGEWAGELMHTAKNGAEVWVESRQELIPVGGSHVVLETNRDISERRRSDEIRSLLVAELNHRVKNTLAIVQSIATQTARGADNVGQYVAKLTGRLQSLAGAHSVLTDAHWSGASLTELVTLQLSAALGDTRNVTVQGRPDVQLPPQTALQLTLVLHELATNALRHGALSRADGEVRIEWELAAEGDRRLRMRWSEHGGPPVCTPAARGFGSLLIERTSQSPHLTARLQFVPTGLVCAIDVNLAEVPADLYFDPSREGLRRMPPPTVRAPRASARRRVMVIADDLLEAMHLEDLLTSAGYLVLRSVFTAEEANMALDEPACDLAVIDVDLGGLAAVPQLTAGLDARRIGFVLITDRPEGVQAAAGRGVRVIGKPLHGAQLVAALREAAGQMHATTLGAQKGEDVD